MSLYFLDTSAVVKLYVQETGTSWLRTLANPASGNFLYLAGITVVEVSATFARRRRGGSLTPVQAAAVLHQFQGDLNQRYRNVAITANLLNRAASLADQHYLRGYDAVQLAAAQELHALMPRMTLISADFELNAAASAEGISTDDPNQHP